MFLPMDEQTLAKFDWNFLEVARASMGTSDTGEYVERRDVAIQCCGLRVQEFNWAFLKPPYEHPCFTANEVGRYFAERELPWKLLLRREGEAACRKDLESAGWRRLEELSPGMSLAPIPSPPSSPAGLELEVVRTPEALTAFRETAFRGFGLPVGAAHIFLNERLQALPHVRLHLGRVDGEPVATALMVATGAVAGVYWVATLEAHRGRGYGGAVSWAAVHGARELGCSMACLQASQLGRPVYVRMGFEHVYDFAHYLPPDA